MNKILALNTAKYLPSLLREIKNVPTFMIISLTHKCNCKCIMCNYREIPAKDELTTDEVKNIIKQAVDVGITDITFYGGEPLLRKDLGELISYSHNSGIRTNIITNGMLLDKERAEELVLSGLEGINISIDTTSELADYIRGVGDAYHKAYSGLNEILQLRKTHKIRVAVGSVLMLPTLKDGSLFKIIELAEKIKVSVGIQLLDFSSFYFRGKNGNTKSDLLITEEHYEELDTLVDKLIVVKRDNPHLIENSVPALGYIKRYFRDPKSKDIPCYIAFSGRIWVSPVGKVFLCQSLPFVGDLRNISLKDTISSSQWKEGIYKMFKKQCPGCSCMYASNIDAHIPLAWKEMASRKLGLNK